MAAFDSYTTLQAEIAGWMKRSDQTARIPTFIAMAEARMNRILREKEMVGRSTASVTTEYVAQPTDFNEAISFTVIDTVGQPHVISPASQAVMDEQDIRTGMPRFYAIVGDSFRLYPAPDQAYTITLTYHRHISALSETNTTNWVLQYHPDAYLYGALSFAGGFLRDEEALSMFKNMFEEAMQEIMAQQRRPAAKLRTDIALQRPQVWVYNINRDF